MNLLTTPDFHDMVQKEVLFFIIHKLAELKGLEKEKRKCIAKRTETSDVDETRDSKRRTMSGAALASWNTELPIKINFPNIMYNTEELVVIPIPFFTHHSLQHILNFTAVLPMHKVYVRDGKSCTIIDVNKLSQILGGELSLNYGQFMEASTNFFTDHYKLKYTMAKNNALQREEVDKVESKLLSQLEA